MAGLIYAAIILYLVFLLACVSVNTMFHKETISLLAYGMAILFIFNIPLGLIACLALIAVMHYNYKESGDSDVFENYHKKYQADYAKYSLGNNRKKNHYTYEEFDLFGNYTPTPPRRRSKAQSQVFSNEPDFTSIDPHKILGLKTSSDESEIQSRYRELAKKYHPDLDTGNEVIMKKINYAYRKLCKES